MDTYKVALELVAAAGELLASFARFDAALASQLKRAVPSVPLNICEAMRRTGRDRTHLLTVAMGSAAEVQAILDVGLDQFPRENLRPKPCSDARFCRQHVR